jgi:hypothetical protein
LIGICPPVSSLLSRRLGTSGRGTHEANALADEANALADEALVLAWNYLLLLHRDERSLAEFGLSLQDIKRRSDV